MRPCVNRQVCWIQFHHLKWRCSTSGFYTLLNRPHIDKPWQGAKRCTCTLTHGWFGVCRWHVQNSSRNSQSAVCTDGTSIEMGSPKMCICIYVRHAHTKTPEPNILWTKNYLQIEQKGFYTNQDKKDGSSYISCVFV